MGQPLPGGAEETSERAAVIPAAPALSEVLAAMEAGDTNQALNLMDRYLPAHPRDEAALALFGQLNLDFADELAAGGQSGGSVIPALFVDAQSAYEKALVLNPRSPVAQAGLARSLRMQQDNAAAWDASTRALALLDPDSPDVQVLEEAGRCGLALTIEARRAGQSAPPAAREAERALRAALEAGSRNAAVPLSDLLAWQEQRREARDVLLAAIDLNPEWPEPIQRLKNLAQSPDDLVADLETARSRNSTSATVLWYLGEARYEQNLAKRRSSDFPAAHEALDRAEECFILAMNQEASYAETCRAWLHLVRTARGWTLREEGRIDDASSAFASALVADVQQLEPEAGPWTLHLGIYAIIDDYFKTNKLTMARAFLRRITEVYQDNPDWMNNLGLACRELGVADKDNGKDAEASKLFEESWAAYSRCVELSPEDPRLVNDRALIAIYYLDHEWELAESELHRAIALGTPLLDSMPESVTQEERNAAEEAVGDAWENLAYLDVMRRNRTDRAERYLEKSVLYYPYQGRAGVMQIRSKLRELTGADASEPEPENP